MDNQAIQRKKWNKNRPNIYLKPLNHRYFTRKKMATSPYKY